MLLPNWHLLAYHSVYIICIMDSDVRYGFLCILHIAIITGKIITITIIITIINM